MFIPDGHYFEYCVTGNKPTVGKFGEHGRRFVPNPWYCILKCWHWLGTTRNPFFWKEYTSEARPTTPCIKRTQMTTLAQAASIWLNVKIKIAMGPTEHEVLLGISYLHIA